MKWQVIGGPYDGATDWETGDLRHEVLTIFKDGDPVGHRYRFNPDDGTARYDGWLIYNSRERVTHE